MRRTPKLVLATAVAGASITGVAFAAASPTVVSGPAANVGQTSAVLTGKVDPNGRSTGYLFAYGPTNAYGTLTATRSAGAGTKPREVTQQITGLLPGTVYHFRVGATSSGGTSTGADRMFKTTGHPPASVVTGGLASIGQTTATPTGTVNPEGETTSWYIEYGLDTTYPYKTSAQTLAAASTPLPVSAQLNGLAPGTLFHYRVVAVHGNIVSAGGDGVFFTEPTRRAVPGIRATTRPGRDRRRPYTFTVGGVLTKADAIPVPQRCGGNIGIRFYNGRRQLAFVVAPVGGNCVFTATASFTRLRGRAPAHVRVRLDYRGTGYVAPAQKVEYVTAG